MLVIFFSAFSDCSHRRSKKLCYKTQEMTMAWVVNRAVKHFLCFFRKQFETCNVIGQWKFSCKKFPRDLCNKVWSWMKFITDTFSNLCSNLLITFVPLDFTNLVIWVFMKGWGFFYQSITYSARFFSQGNWFFHISSHNEYFFCIKIR